MIDAKQLSDAMERALDAFLLHGWLKGLTVNRYMDPRRPVYTTVRIDGELHLQDFARGVAMELQQPGVLGRMEPAPNVDDVLGGRLPQEYRRG